MTEDQPFFRIYHIAKQNDCEVLYPLVGLREELPETPFRDLIAIADNVADAGYEFTESVNRIPKKCGIRTRFELRCPTCMEEHCSGAVPYLTGDQIPPHIKEAIKQQLKDQGQ